MMQQRWNELVVQNPMLIEITRFRRRYFSFSGANSVNGVVMTLVLICYATLILIVAENRTSVSPFVIVIFETGLLTVFAPMMLYGSIAGERERRSWDLLLAAPISKAQIVVGKFMGAMAALGIAVLMFQVPIVITVIYYKEAPWPYVLTSEIISVSFVMSVCALTILFSARVKRGLMALGATLGSLMCLLIVFPSLIEAGGSDHHFNDLSLFLHPFYVLSRLQDLAARAYERSAHTTIVSPYAAIGTDDAVPSAWWGWPQLLVYFAFTAILLTWATNTLSFAENEVKFLPQGHKDA